MSYDLYFWPAGQPDPDDTMDDLDAITPDPAVLAFRREILGLHPELKDVCDPDQEESAAASKYVVLTLPVGWMETVLPGVLEAAVRHGLGGWDPQMGKVPSPEDLEPGEVQYLTEEEAFPYGRGQVAVDRFWTAEEVRDVFDLGPRQIGRAWKLLGLPEQVTFAEAVGVRCVIWLLQYLEPMEADVARTHLHAVAALCKAGPPPEFTDYQVENIHLDVAGVAYALASIPPSLAGEPRRVTPSGC